MFAYIYTHMKTEPFEARYEFNKSCKNTFCQLESTKNKQYIIFSVLHLTFYIQIFRKCHIVHEILFFNHKAFVHTYDRYICIISLINAI